MAVTLGLLARAWKRQASGYTGDELRHPKVILVVALATGVPFLAAAIATLVFVGKNRWTSLVFLGFAGLGGYLLWEYLVRQRRRDRPGLEATPGAVRAGESAKSLGVKA